MSTLITGATGFVGLNLAQALLEMGEEVVLFDLRGPPSHFLACLDKSAGKMRTIIGDVRRPDDIAHAFAAGDITHLFHGAALTPDEQRECDHARDIVDVNLLGTLNLLRAAADAGVTRFVYPSSLTVYGENLYGTVPVDEVSTPPVPDTLYGITKYAAERAVLRLGKLWHLPTVAGRIGSVFGPWEGPTGARDLVSPFAQIAARAARGEAVVLPGRYPTREMIYSRDLATALTQLLFGEVRSEVVNLSTSGNWNDALERWCALLERRVAGFRWCYSGGESATIAFHDTRARAGMNTTRLRDELDFVACFPRDAALDDYADWLEHGTAYFR